MVSARQMNGHWQRRTAARPRCAGAAPSPSGASVGFSPDGTRLFAGGLDGFVTLWDLATGRGCASAKVHQAGVFSVGFDAEGRFVSCAADAVRIWLAPDDEAR